MPDIPFILHFLWSFPHNTHPLPVAEAFDGKIWTVDLSYRWEEHDIDLDSTSAHRNLRTARKQALTNLKRLAAQ